MDANLTVNANLTVDAGVTMNAGPTLSALESLRQSLPEAARDIKLNLQAVLQAGSLSAPQRWGVAIASAAASRHPQLRDALVEEARRVVESAVISAVVDDAIAAAALMGMNNIYYRFRHMLGKPSYAQMPARLRMNRLAAPRSGKSDFELFCLAVSAINGCETCLVAHEKAVLEAGLTEEQVHDAVRIAAVIHAAAVALDGTAPATAAPAAAYERA